MNEHVEETKTVLDVVEHTPDGDISVRRFVQDDSDYPVDPLDKPDYAPAPGKAATEKRQGAEVGRD